jgi:hypothetical protein
MAAGLIKMRAKTVVVVDGERFRPGQVFSTSPANAAALRYQRKADFADTTLTKEQRAGNDAPPVPPKDDAPIEAPEGRAKPAGTRGRGSYNRRDLRADASTGTTENE